MLASNCYFFFRRLSLLVFVYMLAACTSTRSFVDPTFPKMSYDDIQKSQSVKKLKLTVEFQRNGERFEKAEPLLKDSTERVLRASGLVLPDAQGTDGTIHVVVNNLADIGGAVGKGIGTGLTFGLAGSTVTDAYEMQLNITAGGKTFTRSDVKHALHTAIGRTQTPDGLETMPSNVAFERVLEQMLLRVLKEYQSSEATADEAHSAADNVHRAKSGLDTGAWQHAARCNKHQRS